MGQLAGPLLPDEKAALPTQTLAEALTPATFRHPRATRDIMLSGTWVAYALARGKRRTIGFSVGPEGLAVRAPKWVTLADVDNAVQGKSAWILKKLRETRQRHERLESARIEWRSGARFAFMGRQVMVSLDAAHAFDGIGATLQDVAVSATSVLHIALPQAASTDQIRDAAQAWLMRQAKANFIERLNHYAPIVGVQWQKLSLSSAGTRWGSASADGSIRLNWRLIHFRQSVIDYVVVHELSHLRVMDHSPQFWDTVRSAMPNYAGLKAELKTEPLPQW